MATVLESASPSLSSTDSMFLATKIVGPRGRDRSVARPRLLARLGVPPACQVSLIHAAAGFGKTSCLAQWKGALALAGTRVAWLSLDADDDDLHLFIAYVAAAINRACPEAGRDVIDLVARNGSLTLPATLLTLLVNGIASAREPLVLVLDDYHFIAKPEIHDWLAEFVSYAPENLFVALSARSLPPVRLARLRAASQVVEIGPADLALTFDEVREFLRMTTEVEASAGEIDALRERTEGWAAGIQMVGIAARGKKSIAPLIDSFSGGGRTVSSYLEEQVFDTLPPDVRAFLVRTAILERFCADIATVVAGVSDSARIIDDIDRRGLFIHALDDKRCWYRYHHLFADFLLTQLARNEPDELPRLHALAGQWFASKGLWHEAVRHVLQAGDEGRALEIANRCAMDLVRDGDYMVLQSLLAKLPEDMRRRGTMLRLAEAWVMALNAQGNHVERILAEIGSEGSEAGSLPLEAVEPEIRAIRLTLAYVQDDSERLANLLRLGGTPSENPQPWVGDVFKCAASIDHLWHGRLSEARDFYPCTTLFKRVYQLILFGTSWWHQGHAAEAELQWQAAAELADSEAGAGSVMALLPRVMLARLDYERGRFDDVERALAARIALLEQVCVTDVMVPAVYALGWGRAARGDSNGATALFDRMRLLAAERGWVRMEAHASLELLRLCVRTRPERVDHLAQRLRAIGPAVARKTISTHWVGARLCALGAAFQQAMATVSSEPMRTLESVARDIVTGAYAPERVTVGLLLAWAQDEHGDRPAAMETLGRTLARAEGLGMARTVIDSGEWALSILRELRGSTLRASFGVRDDYLDRLLQMAAPAPRHGAEPATAQRPAVRAETLSGREREVLALIARGLSNKEIGRSLSIEPETVKWHVKNLLGKLGAANRIQAVNRARTLALVA
jgi:LuxR family transcriptional regulator, maltose regulon positive regulatory protein